MFGLSNKSCHFTVMVESKGEFFFWPCIKIGDEKVDPLRDLRVTKTLREQEMGHLCLAWSFGQEGETELTEDQTLRSARSIATNSFGQFLIVDGECVKIFRHLDIYLFATHTITIITKKYTKRNVGRNGEEA